MNRRGYSFSSNLTQISLTGGKPPITAINRKVAAAAAGNSSNTNERKNTETKKTDICVATPAKKYVATFAGNSSNSNAGGNNSPTAGNKIVSPAGNKIVSLAGNKIVSPAGNKIVSPVGKKIVSPAGNKIVSPAGNKIVSPAGNKSGATINNISASSTEKDKALASDNNTKPSQRPRRSNKEDETNSNASSDAPVIPSIQFDLPVEGSVVLDYKNVPQIINFPAGYSKIMKLIRSQNYWHKVTVLGTGAENKEVILLRIMAALLPTEIAPVMCKKIGEDLEFLVRGCGPAIDKLCRSRMIIEDNLIPLIRLQVLLGFAHFSKYPIDVPKLLTKVIKKRYSHFTKHLDLSSFHRDPELEHVAFCPLSSVKHVQFVLNSAVNLNLMCKSINLANNFIGQVSEVATYWQVRNLNKIDLRHNMISVLSDLYPLKSGTMLNELWLDQNPVCEKYATEDSYIKDIQEILPSLTRLDGIVLPAPGLPRHRKNFLQEKDDKPLADQFLRYYFTLYDSDRSGLKGLYHKDAFFSLTANYLSNQSTSYTARLTDYVMQSRNLLKISDYSKSLKLLHHGPDEIVKTLIKLPKSEHDPYSLKVDLVHYLDQVNLSVSGVFKEPVVMKAPLIRSFSRVFVLTEVAPKEYQIVNELLNVRNATSEEAEEAFKIKKPFIDPALTKPKSELRSEADKEKMAEVLSNLSKMNMKWSRKCLDETNWDVAEALIVFTELYKMSKIPEEAFLME